MVKKREKNRMTEERVYKRYSILLIAAFVLTPFICLAHTADDPDKSDLIAGQNITVGEVSIWNNDENLYLKYQTDSSWHMTETHLYVGKTNPAELTSAPGQFPYSENHNPAVSEYTYTVLLSEIDSYYLSNGKKWVADGTPGVEPGDEVYIMAHAEGGDSETAWKEGDPVGGPGAGWAMYNTYQIQKFPWVKVSISGTELVWDVFKPGRYMSLGPVLTITSNVAVAILFGTLYGTGYPEESALGPAVRKGSLLSKDSSDRGTPPDEIRLWATCLWGEASSPHAGDSDSVPPANCISDNPEDLFGYWIDFSHLDGYQMTILESVELKNGIAFSWYNMINVDPSNSEGNYLEQFVITISAEP